MDPAVLDTSTLDRELAIARERLAPEEEFLHWAARGSQHLGELVRSWIALDPPARVVAVAAQPERYRGGRAYDHTNEVGRRIMELREAVLGPSIRAARALVSSPEVHDHLLANAADPAVAALTAMPGLEIPRAVRAAVTLARPDNVVLRVGPSVLTIVSDGRTILDGRYALLERLAPRLLATAGRRLGGAPRGEGPMRSAPGAIGPRYALLRLEKGPEHYARVFDLADAKVCAPERYASGPDRTLVAIDDAGADFRTSRPGRPLGEGTMRLEWHELEWRALDPL